MFNKVKITLTNINNQNGGKWLVFDSLNDTKYVKDLKGSINKIEQQVSPGIKSRVEV